MTPVLLFMLGLLGLMLALWIIGFMEGERPLLDLWYEYHLAGQSLSDLDVRSAGQADRCDVVISLTSIPSRLAMIEPTLKSLLCQTLAAREIRLYLPGFSHREQLAYSVPEGWQIAPHWSHRIAA